MVGNFWIWGLGFTLPRPMASRIFQGSGTSMNLHRFKHLTKRLSCYALDRCTTSNHFPNRFAYYHPCVIGVDTTQAVQPSYRTSDYGASFRFCFFLVFQSLLIRIRGGKWTWAITTTWKASLSNSVGIAAVRRHRDNFEQSLVVENVTISIVFCRRTKYKWNNEKFPILSEDTLDCCSVRQSDQALFSPGQWRTWRPTDDRTLHRPSAPMEVNRKHPIGASKRAMRADRRILLVAPMRRLRLTSRMAPFARV